VLYLARILEFQFLADHFFTLRFVESVRKRLQVYTDIQSLILPSVH
jgi:hypothetical protein